MTGRFPSKVSARSLRERLLPAKLMKRRNWKFCRSRKKRVFADCKLTENPSKHAHAGQRTAVNLGGIDYDEIERGMILTAPNVLRPTQIFDAEIEVLKDAKKSLKSRQRVRVHIGTIEALARVQVLNEIGEIKQGRKRFCAAAA